MKKIYQLEALVISLIAVVVVFVFLASGTLEPIFGEKTAVYLPRSVDAQNIDQGTISFHFSFSNESFMVGDKMADAVIFFSSKTISGLQIIYHPQTHTIYSGLPALKAEQVVLLDQKIHDLVYKYNKVESKQSLHLDGKELVQGEYTGEEHTNKLIGFASKENFISVERNLDVDITISDEVQR